MLTQIVFLINVFFAIQHVIVLLLWLFSVIKYRPQKIVLPACPGDLPACPPKRTKVKGKCAGVPSIYILQPAEWSLTINGSKTERTSISRHVDRIEEEWRMTRKLGSLLGEAEDVARRKQLANVAFRKLSTVWFRRAHISLCCVYECTRVVIVIPVLTYNMGTWGLTQADLVRIDTYHRRHLRQIIGVRWPNRISNVALYHRCQSRPISESVITARWRLFGHVLRLPRDAPAQRAIDHYFADTEAATFRGRPQTSLPSTLCSDLRRIGRTLRQPADIEALRAFSREQWRQMERDTSAWDELPYPLTHILSCLPRIYLFLINLLTFNCLFTALMVFF